MLTHLRIRSGALLATVLVAALGVTAVHAQNPGVDEMSEAEREKAAKAEQDQRRREAQAAERDATRSAEDAAEAERLTALGASDAGPLLEEKDGFFLRLDAFWTQVDGAETVVARVADIVTSATTAEELDSDGDLLPDAFSLANERDLSLEYDSVVTPQVELGWRMGSGAALSVRWWSLSQDASVSVTSSLELASGAGGAPLRLGGIDSPGVENDVDLPSRDPAALVRALGSVRLVSENRLHGADSVVADGKVEASRLDLLYSRTALARPRFVLSYRVGLSAVDFDRQESATFVFRSLAQDQVNLNATAIESVTTSSETSAVGITAGLAGKWLFGEARRWGVRFGVDVAGLQADPKLRFRDSQVFDDDVVEARETVYQDVTTDGGEDFITILEGDLAFEAQLSDRFQLSLGYRQSNWIDALTDTRFPSPDNGALMTREVMDVDLGGPYVRVGFFF